MNYLTDLVLLLILAKLFGLPLKRKGIHPIVGHVVAGIILGPYILGVVEPSMELSTIAGVALLLLLFYTGLTTDFRELQRRSVHVVFMGVSGVAVTFTLVYMVLYCMGITGLKAVFIALALSNTATETVAATIAYAGGREIKALIIGASFVDDIVAAFLISIVSSMSIGSSNILYLSIATTIYMAIVFGLSQLLSTRFTWFYRALSRDYTLFAGISVIIAFTLSIIARAIGLSELIGAYMAGLLIGRGREFHDPFIRTRIVLTEFIDDLSVVLEALFIPMFFTFIGLLITPSTISITLYTLALVAAIAGKVVGCTPIAIASLGDRGKGVAAGIAMIGRGALETALLKLGLDTGILGVGDYSTIILVALTTTVIAPLLYSIVYRE